MILNTHFGKIWFVTLVPKWLLILTLQNLQRGREGRPHASVQCLHNNLTLMFRNKLFLKQYYKKYMLLLCREVKEVRVLKKVVQIQILL